MATQAQFTVKQLARMAGVSARTLHYYDQIGLLKPSRDPRNGYRIYTRPALLRLQQILFLRVLDLSLEQIRSVLDQPDYELLSALHEHERALRARQKRLGHLLDTVERTILHLKGKYEMQDDELFAGFSEEKQREYELEAQRRWGPENVMESQKRWGSYTNEKKQQIMEEGQSIYLDLVDAMTHGPASPQAQDGIGRWHQHLRYFYEPTSEILLGLADLYNEDPEYSATFQRIHPELAAFMRQAINVYCQSK